MASSHFSSLSLFFLFFASIRVTSGALVFEDGYTVTTLLDGNKLNINPHSVLPRPGSSDDFIVLDSAASSFFTVSLFQPQQDGMIKRFAGNINGKEGFSDGDLESSMFRKPKSFAVDLKGNVYVADQYNHVIRKISNSGVTTIAGGYTRKTGKVDGSAQNASFSDDFELTFIPEKCALVISDRGNRLLRQIDLKSGDCAKGSQSVLGTASAWALGLGLSCLIGLIIGFAIRPYILPHEGSRRLLPNVTWKHCLINLERQVLILCFDIRSAIVNSKLYALLNKLVLLCLSTVSLMFRVNLVESQKTQTSRVQTISLLDADVVNSDKVTMSEMFSDQLKDLLRCDEGVALLDANEETFKQENGNEEKGNVVLCDSQQRIEEMIQTNLLGFTEQAGKTSLPDPSVTALGLVKRR